MHVLGIKFLKLSNSLSVYFRPSIPVTVSYQKFSNSHMSCSPPPFVSQYLKVLISSM